MFDQITHAISEFAANVRLADVLDVGVVATFLYGIISWFRQDASRETSRRILVAVMIFMAVYVPANLMQMFLVKQFLEVLLIVFLLAVVVVFQAEIRRMLDRIANWSLFRKTATEESAIRTIDILTESAARMSDRRMGALIAVKGRDSWDALVQGGIELNGQVSQPLLYSLFHHDTPGHDGVTLVEGDKVTRFAGHLPLSSNVPEVSRFGGTRHAAALGLAENSDAFVITVSEERGTISVAEGNHIDEMGSAGELKERLTHFWKKHYERPDEVKPKWWTRPSLQTATLSVLIASLLWFMVAYEPEPTIRTFTVPIEYRNLPSDWTLGEPSTNNALVSLRGTERAFRILEPGELSVAFDMSDIDSGQNQFSITEDNLNLPSEISLYDVQPRSVRVQARRLQTIEVPVSVRRTGELPDSLEVVSLSPDPGFVQLLVPENDPNPPERVFTEPVNLDDIRESTSVTTHLIPPDDDAVRLHPDVNGEVTVEVEIARIQPTESSP